MPYWAVAQTLVRRESFAASRLLDDGFDAFAPKIHTGALFPGYIFIHIEERWRSIDRTVGVLKLVKFGEHPARCPDAEIAKLRAQLDDKGFVRLPPPSKTTHRDIPIGARVRVAGGFNAIYAGMTVRERQIVLMDILGRQRRVVLPPGQTIELVDRG
jgi:transcriptional antiterminator RfaH